MIIIATIVYLFWAVLGLFFWLPLLFKVIAGFCGTLVYNMVVNNPERTIESKVSLDLAISFYAKGFHTIHSTLYEKPSSTGNKPNNEFHFFLFFGQVLWTLLFWGLTIFPFTKHSITNYLKTVGYSTSKYVEEADRYLSIHDTTTAISMMTGAINKDEFNAEFYYKRGMLYLNTSDFYNAVRDLESAIKIDSIKFGTDPLVAWNIGTSLSWKLKESEKAIPYFTKTIKYSTKFANAYFQRGWCYHDIDEKDLALLDYNSTISLDPNFGIAYSNKGLLLIDKGQKAEACQLFDQAIRAGYTKSSEYKKSIVNKQ